MFNRTVSNLSTLWTMQADGTGARQLAQGSLAIATNPRADRAGRAVVFEGIREVGILPEVYQLTFPDGRVTQLTRENGANAGRSANGRTVTSGGPPKSHKRRSCGRLRTVVPRRGSSKRRRLSTMRCPLTADRSPSSPSRVLALPGHQPSANGDRHRTLDFYQYCRAQPGSVVPAGDALLLSIEENRQTNLFRLELAGGPPRQLTRFTRGVVLNAEISPDGRRIAYHRGMTEPDIVLVKPRRK